MLQKVARKIAIELGIIPDPALREFEPGTMQGRIVAIIAGVLTITIGLVLGTIVVDQAATAGADTGKIGSFAGARSIMNLVPLIYYTAIVMLGVGMIGIGAGGFMGRGPMAGN